MVIALAIGLTTGPPAESEYPVEPVGVEMIMPSAEKVDTYFSSTLNSISIILGQCPLSITISLIAIRLFSFPSVHSPQRVILSSILYSPFSSSSISLSRLLISYSARNPNLPKLIPSIGVPYSLPS